jgi:docking protein 2
MLFARSTQGLERLEISDSETDKNPRIVTLENCIKVYSESQPSLLINVITKTGQIQFQCTNETELSRWTKQLQSVAFNDKLAKLVRITFEEYKDNDLYFSSPCEEKFKVTLVSTDASIKNKLESKIYTLLLTLTEIQLKSYEDDNSVIANWPYRYIRKYGYKDGMFTFEAGRKCKTGEGTFKIDHTNPQKIFRCMAAKMKSTKQLLNGDSSGNMEENQLHAALSSMEAGSRSPLLPSINSPSSPDVDISQASFRGFISTDTMNLNFLPGPSTSNASSQPPTPPAKNLPIPIPNKPPRKIIHNDRIMNTNFHETLVQLDSPPTPPERNKSMTAMAARDYECIENITDAWKTLGISDVKHVEHVSKSENELKEFVWQRSKSFNRNETRKVSIVDINENSTSVSNSNVANDSSDNDYDRLDFFPPSNSGNKVTSSGYTTIVPIIPPPAKKKPPISDDYEIINPPGENSSTSKPSTSSQQQEPPELLPSRIADDSYLGYGVIRKTSLPASTSSSSTIVSFSSTSTSQTVVLSDNEFLDHDHQIPLDYAIVSKPKRV